MIILCQEVIPASSLAYVQIKVAWIFDNRKKDTKDYFLQPRMHIKWLKVSRTPLKKLSLNYASVFRYSTANDSQTGNDPQPQMIPDVDRK